MQLSYLSLQLSTNATHYPSSYMDKPRKGQNTLVRKTEPGIQCKDFQKVRQTYHHAISFQIIRSNHYLKRFLLVTYYWILNLYPWALISLRKHGQILLHNLLKFITINYSQFHFCCAQTLQQVSHHHCFPPIDYCFVTQTKFS
jgi:hypothetical protein